MKKCSKCFLEKDLSEFAIDRSTKDGHRADCKACQKAYQQAHREETNARCRKSYAAHGEERREYNRQYRKTHPRNTEQDREYRHLYYLAHREEIISKNKEYNRLHRIPKNTYKIVDPLKKDEIDGD